MRLSLQQKEQFFHEMRELLRSGQSIPAALELKRHSRSGVIRRIAETMLSSATSETNAGGYFAAVRAFFPRWTGKSSRVDTSPGGSMTRWVT